MEIRFCNAFLRCIVQKAKFGGFRKRYRLFSTRGVFGAMPPPPPFVTWAEGLSTETVGEDLFLKSGLNLSEDLFFCSSPNFGPETT